MTTPIRLVAPSERGFVGRYPTTIAFEATITGDLDLCALADAFAAVRAEHPALDARIIADEATGESAFAPSGTCPADRIALTVERVDTLADVPPAPELDPTHELCHLHVETTGSRHRVGLAASHALTDGAHLFTLFSRLWAQYTRLIRLGAVAPAPEIAFPASAQELLAGLDVPGLDTGRDRLRGARWYGAAPTLRPDTGLAATHPPEVSAHRFSAQATARLVTAARDVGTNALISGLLLMAERAGFVDAAPDETIRIGAMTLVDLRRRIRPVATATEVTNFVGASFAAVDVRAQDDPAVAGTVVADALRADLASGRALAVLADSAPEPPAEPPVVLSNLGVLDIDLPDGLTAEDLRPRMCMDSTGLHVPAGARTASPSATIYQVSTFAGRLGVEAITLGGTASAASRAAVRDRLIAGVEAANRYTTAA